MRCEKTLELSWAIDTSPYWGGEARPECERNAAEGQDVASSVLGEGVPDGRNEARIEISCLFCRRTGDCVVPFALDRHVIAVGYGRRF